MLEHDLGNADAYDLLERGFGLPGSWTILERNVNQVDGSGTIFQVGRKSLLPLK
jgi:hypothetical protein